MILLRQILKHPAGRVALAIALSLLIHATLLIGPDLIRTAPVEAPLPPLTARLEPLPTRKPAPEPVRKKVHKPKPAKIIHPEKSVTVVSRPVETAPEIPAPAVDTASGVGAAESQPASAVAQTEPDEHAVSAHPLPMHAQLTFTVKKGVNFPVGEARHTLDIDDKQHYTLQTNIRTVGLASLFKTFDMNQKSSGTISAQGLRPDEYSEGRTSDKGVQALTAKFDWAGKTLTFSGGAASPLPAQSQDMLSFLYQLSQLPLDQAIVSIYISNGKKLEKYDLAVGAEEDILTKNGQLRALPLRKIHAPGEEGLEVWLGMEYRLLPVKIRQIDRHGEIAGEMVITDIRVSEKQTGGK